jgi:hypothetical protein
VQLNAYSDAHHSAWVKRNVVLHRNNSEINLSLREGATIPISVQAELSSEPQAGSCSGIWFGNQTKAVDCAKFPAMITLAPAESTRMQVSAEAESADPGSLAFRSVMPGKYRVHVQPLVYAYVHSVRSGTTDLLRDDLIVGEGASTPAIEVQLRDDGARVKIHVQAERMPLGARILLLPDVPSSQRAVLLETSTSGDAESANLPPGDYKVLAFESIEGIEYRDPEVLQKYSAKTGHVTLGPHGSGTVTIELIHLGE